MKIVYCPECGEKMRDESIGWRCPKCKGFVSFIYGKFYPHIERPFVPPMSNADRLRAMSDEELAIEMCQRSISTICDIVCQGDCKAIATLNKTCGEVCKEIIMKWLQQLYEGE